MATNLKERSRQNFNVAQEGKITFDEIQTGCMQRIADATEVMAKNNNDLIRERDSWKNKYHYKHEEAERLDKQVTNLKRVNTRYKNRITQLEEEIKKLKANTDEKI